MLFFSTVEPRCLEVPRTYNPSSSHPNFEASESGFFNVFIEIKVVIKRIFAVIQHYTIVYVFYAVKIQRNNVFLFICVYILLLN